MTSELLKKYAPKNYQLRPGCEDLYEGIANVAESRLPAHMIEHAISMASIEAYVQDSMPNKTEEEKRKAVRGKIEKWIEEHSRN